MKKIIHLSDTHKREDLIKINKCDILIHSGDANISMLRDLNLFISWMVSQPAKHRIYVAGNHDDMCEAVPELVKQIFKENNIIYLENEEAIIDGIKFWGSPYTPQYNNWAFMKSRGDAIMRVWKMIPDDTDILITHGPPMNILDFTIRGNIHCGCWDLDYMIKKIKPKLHLFGHVHEGFGHYKNEHTAYYNGSILNENYEFQNAPHEIMFEEK